VGAAPPFKALPNKSGKPGIESLEWTNVTCMPVEKNDVVPPLSSGWIGHLDSPKRVLPFHPCREFSLDDERFVV